MKYLINKIAILFAFALAFSTSLNASTLILTMDASNAQSVAEIAGGGLHLTINGTQIPFFFANNPASYKWDNGYAGEGRRVQYQETGGELPKNRLVVGNNMVSTGFVFGEKGQTPIVGTYISRLILNRKKPNEREICKIVVTNGKTGDSCSGEFALSLEEVDKQLFDQLSQAEKDLKARKALFDQAKGSYDEKLSQLENTIKEISNKTFDELSEDDLKNIGWALELYRNLKKDADKLEGEINAKISEIKNNFESTKQGIDEELKEQIGSIELPEQYAFKKIVHPEPIVVPAGPDKDPFDEANNSYDLWANETIANLKYFYDSNDRFAAVAVVNRWISENDTLLPIVQQRAKVSNKEWVAYQNSIKKVELYLFGDGSTENPGIMTRDFWFKDSPVPNEDRELVSNVISKVSPDKGKELEASLKTWRGKTLTPQQEQALQLVRTIGVAFKMVVDKSISFEKKFNNWLDGTIEAVKGTIKCGSTVLAAGDFGDLYEIVGGIDICSGEKLTLEARAISGVALMAGSAKFWREVGEKTFGIAQHVKDVAKKADKIEDAAKSLGWKGTKEAFEDIGPAVRSLKKEGKLPANYLTKDQAKKLGWEQSKGNLGEVAPGKMIGGDVFANRKEKLPTDKTYLEADLGYRGGYRGTERMVYSSDGSKIYITNDHYETFTEIK